jgi:hypothetical protein
MSTPNPTHESSANRAALPVDLRALVLHELVAAQKRGLLLKAIADDARMPGWRLYEIAQGKKRLTFEEADRLMTAIGSTRLLDGLARNVGAVVFFLRPMDAAGQDDLYQAFEAAVEDLAAIAREKRAALADDGQIDDDEATRIVARIERAQGTLEAYKTLVYQKTVPRRADLRAVGR